MPVECCCFICPPAAAWLGSKGFHSLWASQAHLQGHNVREYQLYVVYRFQTVSYLFDETQLGHISTQAANDLE